eukprot:SAG11_NODE_6190_length_1368_cov_1.386919_2_plen_114_part_00
MIMSEYNYSVHWIAGIKNPVGDCLSRLISIPEFDWVNVEPDDDTVHPFLMCRASEVSEPLQTSSVVGECSHIHTDFGSKKIFNTVWEIRIKILRMIGSVSPGILSDPLTDDIG